MWHHRRRWNWEIISVPLKFSARNLDLTKSVPILLEEVQKGFSYQQSRPLLPFSSCRRHFEDLNHAPFWNMGPMKYMGKAGMCVDT